MQLEEERRLQQAVLQAIPDLVWLKDTEGVFLSCNPRFEAFYGATERDIVGHVRRVSRRFLERILDVLADGGRREAQKTAQAVGGQLRSLLLGRSLSEELIAEVRRDGKHYRQSFVRGVEQTGVVEIAEAESMTAAQPLPSTRRLPGLEALRLIAAVCVLLLHALKNAAVPIVTVIGIGIALLISGVVITETVFNIPGLGRLTVDAVLKRDYPIVQGLILVFAGAKVVVNLLIDISYAFLDPRIRY